MWRALLTCWFAIHALLGQGLCCCAFLSNLPSRLLTASGLDCPRHPKASDHSSGGCCDTPPETDLSRLTLTGNAPAGPCPCRVIASREIVSTSPETEKSKGRQLAPTRWEDGVASSLLLAALLSPPPFASQFARAPDLPFHPTSELLHVFHRLRC
jgi:hypothetical protein